MSQAVLPLDHELCERPEIAGNKAATLSRLLRRGYPVLPGACVTVAGLAGEGADWEPALAEALAEVAAPWVVRSSSTAEDSPTQPLAGAFESVVGVRGRSALRQAVRAVHASLRSEAARRRAAGLGIDLARARMAVLVQPVAAASASGVAFGRDPVSGAPVVVIEANHGLPQTVVDGSVTPDDFTVDASGGIVGSPGSKLAKAVLGERGVEVVPTTEEERSRPALAEPAVLRLAELVRELGRLLEAPQDVEWALVAEGPLILQSRPVTVPARPAGGRP